MSELKPCPFCSAYPIPNIRGVDWVMCECGTAATDRKKWNTRPIEDALNAIIAALEAENARLKAEARWIPVSERLPLRGQEIWAKEAGNHKITRFLYSPELESIFVRHYTHWRELPAPPDEA